MISLKKYIESNRDELLGSVLGSYRAALEAIGNSGSQVCPPAGQSLQENLKNLQQHLVKGEVTISLIQEAEQRVNSELQKWGQDASDYFKRMAGEFKEMLMVIARTGEAVGERDQQYASQFQEFTTRLESIADMHNVTAMRESIIRGADDLRACARKMVEDRQQSVAHLREQVVCYQARLDDSEKLAAIDDLTGLDNRRTVEAAIELRLKQARPFSVLIFDLNGFKQVNDTYGHLAGDELLKQFAGELKTAFRSLDLVGRWGGDEFIVVLDCGLDEARTQIERVRQWAFGDYAIKGEGVPCKIAVAASVGLASNKRGDTLATLLDRADKAMYDEKRSTLKTAAGDKSSGAVSQRRQLSL